MSRKTPDQRAFKKLRYAPHKYSLGCEVAQETNPRIVNTVDRNPKQCLTFTGRVANYETEIIIDSGSGISIISFDLFTLINKHTQSSLDISSNAILAKTPTGEYLDIVGTTTVELDLGESNWYVDCHVVKNFNYAFLLGTDFLIKTSSRIDLGSMKITIGQQTLDVSAVNQPSQVKVCVVDTIEIPPRSEAVLQGSVSGLQGEVLIEPKHEVSCSNSLLYPARSIANINNGIVPVKIVNTNSCPVKIFAGTCVGMAEVLKGQEVKQTKEGKSHDVPSISNSLSWLDDIDLTSGLLSESEKSSLVHLLIEYRDVFVSSDLDLGRAHRFSHRINTGENAPFRQRPYRIAQSQLAIVDKHIEEMLDKSIIQESNSPWSLPLVIVTKKDGSPRFCVDFRKLNNITKQQIFPMPRVDEVLDSLGDACYFTTLDLASGYWQIPMDPKDMEKTAFCTRQGNFEFRVMPMGLVNASFTFQKMMQLVLSGLQWQICMIYLDDVIVYSKSFEKHLENLRLVFDRLKYEGLKLKARKCHFCRTEVLYLGHIVGKDGIKPNPDKIAIIQNYPVPRDCSEIRSFVALVSYYRRFIKNFASIATPLNYLLKKGVKFVWTDDCQLAFECLRNALVEAPILSYPNFNERFVLYTDASNTGIGAVLAQDINGVEQTIAYASRSLKPYEKKYATIEKECLAIVWGIKYFRPYLYGRSFDVVTDHNPLKWLDNARDPHSRLSRWSLSLQSYYLLFAKVAVPLVSAVNAPGLQLDEVRAKQRQDPALEDLINYFEKGEIPANSVSARRLMATADDYIFEEGILYHLAKGRARSREGIRKQLVIPRSLKDEVMLAMHEEITSGHLGFEKTYHKIQQRYFWIGMYSEIQKWCASCVDCATKKTLRNLPKAPLQPIPVEGPFDRVAVDVLGPFPTSDQGNKYVIVFSDYFTKWPEAFAVKTADAVTTAKLFVEEILCRHSAPRKLLSDRGKNFLSRVVKDVCQLVNTSKVNTISYHPECDGLVERFNHSLTTIISMYVSEHQSDWDRFIPYALFAYRTSIQSSINETPFYLLYGRDPRFPMDISLSKPDELYNNTDNYRSVLINRFIEAHKLAHDNIELAQQRQKANYDKKAKEVSYSIGQRAWLFTPNNRKGLSSKLTHNWHGPYRILAKKSPVNYLLDSNDERNYMQIVHVNRLKPFISYDSRPETADSIDDFGNNDNDNDKALQENLVDEEAEEEDPIDPAELEVKAILDKKVIKNRSGRKQTYYLIEWADTNIEPSWEPLNNLHCGKVLKEFEDSLLVKKSK